MNDLPQRSWNVVPFRALVYAFVMDADARKIFGPSAEHFRALKEILLASDTNRLVAELTFVRINDLAAPQTASDPFLFLEPFVALLIVVNAVLLVSRPMKSYSIGKVGPWSTLGSPWQCLQRPPSGCSSLAGESTFVVLNLHGITSICFSC